MRGNEFDTDKGNIMAFDKIAVLGLGKVGHLAAELLADAGFAVTGIDAAPPGGAKFATRSANLADTGGLQAVLKDQQAVLSCLPFSLNKGVSSAAPNCTPSTPQRSGIGFVRNMVANELEHFLWIIVILGGESLNKWIAGIGVWRCRNKISRNEVGSKSG